MSERKIKRTRAIRSALAVVFSIPPLAMFVLDPVRPTAMAVPWPMEWQAVFVTCMAISFAAGWGPVKASLTGEDWKMYVDEPEVNDDQ